MLEKLHRGRSISVHLISIGAIRPPNWPSTDNLPSANSGKCYQAPQLTCQKLFKTQHDVAVPIFVVPFEYVRHLLQRNTTLYKQVETHVTSPFALIVSLEQKGYERWREVVSKLRQGVRKLVQRNVAAAILIKAVKEVAPGG